MRTTDIVLLAVSAILAIFGLFYGKTVKKKISASQQPSEKLKRMKKLCFLFSLAGAWLFTVQMLAVIFGKGERGEFTVELTAPRIPLFGFEISSTVVFTWVVMAVLTVAALIIRLFYIPHFKDEPKGLQNLLELAVEELTKYTDSRVKGMGVSFGAYIFTLALFMIGCAFVELFGVRAPTADITMTFAMALITFFLINYYGIRRKGIGGRIKSLASPTPLVFPIRVISDIAIPVSMACRLFGNMLGGMIVMDLLYYAMGGAAVGIPSVVGLYFNVFHPLIQAFIFVTLTLTFIDEATEEAE